MSLNPETLQQISMEILTSLVNDIGPRPAGSDGEKQAFDWLEKKMQSVKLQTRRFPVRYQPDPVVFPYYIIAAAGFALVGFVLPNHGWTTLLLPLLILMLPEGMQWLQGKLLPYKDGSANVLAIPENTRLEDMDVILCAHVDTARAVPDGPTVWKKWRDRIMYTMMRVANILIIPGLFQMIGLDTTGIILSMGQYLAWTMAAALVLQDIWEQVGSLNRFSPGANDDGSGTAFLAAEAMAMAREPAEKLKVGFLFTGAEECGLHGARQFAAYMTENKMKIPVISLDMVGAGNGLRIITRCGTIAPIKTDSELNDMLKRADPLAIFHAAPRRWGDFVPFVRAGIPAAHVENTGTPLSWATYHTPGDTLDVIDPEMFQRMGDFLNQLFWILEKDKPNPVE